MGAETWLYILLAALALICAYLLARHVQLKKDILKLSATAREMRAGNFNLRYRLRTTRADTLALGGELNNLTDSFQAAMDRARFLEEDRKRMVSNISHDLRTPLTALLGYIEALRWDGTLSGEEREDFLRIAAEKGAGLQRLLQEFFELARLEEESAEDVRLEAVDLAELARAALLGFYPEFTETGIAPVVSIPEGPVFARGNPDYIRRVLDNLVSNALRYGRDGQMIGVEVYHEGDHAVVEVWDNGKGISPEDLPYIFERLYTAEASRGGALRGSGLGLTIARNLAEKQGGRIFAESAPGEKTVFSFRLPA